MEYYDFQVLSTIKSAENKANQQAMDNASKGGNTESIKYADGVNFPVV